MRKEYLEFRTIRKSESGKTKIINVLSKESGGVLAQIRWFAHLRKYTLKTYDDYYFDSTCLNEIVNELDRLNFEHKSKTQ